MRAAAALALAVITAAPAAAQTYPSKPIELIVPFVAGGTTDTAARMIGQRLNR
jgi:tripartite-type tricarboxylate transporter receptor subunit TctC